MIIIMSSVDGLNSNMGIRKIASVRLNVKPRVPSAHSTKAQ